MTRKEMKEWLEDELSNADECEDMEGNAIKSAYLGSYMSMDPCGRYHHCLSPNGATSKCERFWESMEAVADELGACIESGEGDPTDIYITQAFEYSD